MTKGGRSQSYIRPVGGELSPGLNGIRRRGGNPKISGPLSMGDLINIDVKNGKGSMMHTTNRITLSPGRLGILDEDGSSFIIHTNGDTYCDEGSDLKKGCAGGARDACGIITAD